MGSLDLAQTVVVLDLDDTLYLEADYQNSGLIEVCNWIESLYSKDIRKQLFEKKEAGEKNLLGIACSLAGLPLDVKESLLWIYRLHKPNIQLSDMNKAAVRRLEEHARAVVVLTDGRSVSQRNKLMALGLMHLPVYISEEYCSEKPAPKRFELIMRDFPAEFYVYVGDNPAKDFIAPNELGWITYGLRGGARNVHRQFIDECSPNMAPTRWISDLHEILD